MEPERSFKSGIATSTQSPFQRICAAVGQRPRSLWTACAATSLTTSKYLFTKANLNYPVHIHLLQIAVVATYLTVTYVRRSLDGLEGPSRIRSASSWMYLTFLACIMALAVACTLQAILHLHNTTAVVMFSLVACIGEQLGILFSRSKRTYDYIWPVLSAICCALVLYADYRLHATGLRATLCAVILTTLARARYSSWLYNSAVSESDSRRFDILFCCTGILVNTIWLQVFTEHTWRMMLDVFQWRYAPVLIGNIVSTATAMLLGRSILVPPLPSEHSTTLSDRAQSRSRDALTNLMLTGVTGVYLSFTIRRSYTTSVQVGLFLAALLFFGGSNLTESIRTWRYGPFDGYNQIDDSVRLEPIHDERISSSEDTEWSEETHVAATAERPTPTRTLFYGKVLSLGLLWIAFCCLNFQEATPARARSAKPVLDLTYKAPIPYEIVISMYKEPVSDVKTLISTVRQMPGLSHARATIYLKDVDGNAPNIRSLTNAHNVTIIPNVGREGETYLYHILNRWDSLAHQTFFLQADVHNPRQFFPRIRNYFWPKRTGMLSLGWSGNICDCHSCGDQWQWTDHTHLFPKIHQRINNSTSCTDVLLSYKGQFVVSAARIRGVPKSVYHDLREAFVDEKSWAHQPEFLRGRHDTMSQPQFGYTMERMWNLLFQCADTDVAWKCPTLLSGWRTGGSIADCQCFDDE